MVSVGDTLLVRPGARVPADAAVVQGESKLDESMITGESKPVIKAVGSHMIAGTVNVGSGTLTPGQRTLTGPPGGRIAQEQQGAGQVTGSKDHGRLLSRRQYFPGAGKPAGASDTGDRPADIRH